MMGMENSTPATKPEYIDAHGIFIRYADEKRGAWFTPRGTTNRLRIHAALARTDAELAEFHRITDEIRGHFAVALAEVRKL